MLMSVGEKFLINCGKTCIHEEEVKADSKFPLYKICAANNAAEWRNLWKNGENE